MAENIDETELIFCVLLNVSEIDPRYQWWMGMFLFLKEVIFWPPFVLKHGKIGIFLAESTKLGDNPLKKIVKGTKLVLNY